MTARIENTENPADVTGLVKKDDFSVFDIHPRRGNVSPLAGWAKALQAGKFKRLVLLKEWEYDNRGFCLGSIWTLYAEEI